MKKDKIMKVVIFVVVLLIPIIYSFFYLKSYWNPYGDLTQMKIAVVNLDEGKDNENQGKEFVNELKNDGTFDICEVNLDNANEGMQNGDYYATILIPSNFTQCLNSASTKDKQIATITYSPNQATNYLATQIIGSAIKTIETNLQAKVNSKVAENLAQKLEEVPSSLQDISDGAGQILEGSKSLNSGIEQINAGTNKLNNSYTEFNTGINSAYEGSKTVDNGLTQVNSGVNTVKEGAESLNTAMTKINEGVDEISKQGSAGVTELAQGITKLNEGAKGINEGVTTYVDTSSQVASGTNSYIEGTNKLTSLVNQYTTSVNSYNENVDNLLNAIATQGANSTDPNMQKLAVQAEKLLQTKTPTKLQQLEAGITKVEGALTTSSQKLQKGTQGLLASEKTIKQKTAELYAGTQALAQKSSGLNKIMTGIGELKVNLMKVQTGTNSLETGVNTLSQGTTALKSGTNSLSNGLSKLNNSSTDIKSALNTLSEGTGSAYTGSTQLVSGIETFNNKINNGITDTNKELENLNGIEDFVNDPVEFKTESYGNVDSYGIAFTPLFLSIGLWVGALMGYVVLYYDQKNRFGILGSTSKHKYIQNLLYIVIGAIEGLITAALLKMGLGYEIQNTALYYFASALIGVTFTSIIQCLIRNFGDVGKFLALIILVLQLAASGGTFPVETIDAGFQSISSFLPMTYSIKLFREILVPTASNFKGQYIAILVGITITTVAITYIVDFIRNRKNIANKVSEVKESK